MAVNIELKRSAVPGKVPTTGSLNLGEIAINTFDGKAYFKKDDGTQSIIELATTSGSSATSSYALTSSLPLQGVVTASAVNTTITFTKGDGTTFSVTTSQSGSVASASYADFAVSASYALSASNAQTASFVLNAVSSSYATTASSADNFTVRGTLTAQTIVAQTITSSTEFITGSTKFGSIITNTHQFTGSVSISGSLSVFEGVINNLTASNAVTASYALTASFVPGLNLSQISTGSIVASVDVDPSNLFLIKSGSTQYFNISSSGNTTLSSDLFIIKNFTTQQPVVTVSQSIVQFATQSTSPTGIAPNGGFWFTSADFYVGLD
jgi:hypothetical protein